MIKRVWKNKRITKRTLSTVLLGALLLELCVPIKSEAALPEQKTLTLKAARALTIQNSDAIESCEDEILSKTAAYESAVKAVTLKEKALREFRWSPLLSFKFPEDPNFSEASEFQYKPLAAKYEITVAEHKLQDKMYEVNEKTNNLYTEIVVLQETIGFNEKRVTSLEEGLARNQAKLRSGEATKADIDKIEKKLTSTKSKIAADKRTLEADLKKLSDMVGMDVTTGYKFEKPYVEATIERSMLPALMQYTEDRDETYFEACIAETTARAELNTNSGLIRNKFGGDYNIIASYVSSGLNGEKVNKKAFKAAYKNFLTKIDSYWEGSKRILFIKIPRLWFKGDLDGTRYISDDPNILYQNVIDYTSAVKDKEAAKKELDQSVEDAFNNYISVRNSYKQFQTDLDSAEANLKKDEIRNRAGELSFEEYNSEMESYEELQNSMLDAMKLYTTTLYSFDRLTCGGISAILSGTDSDMQTAVVGESYPEKQTKDGAYYTLTTIIQNLEFELAVIIPDGFEVEITDYELWVDGIQVGTRLKTDQKLRHLSLIVNSVTEAKIRLYNGDKFVDDCVIDPSKESGPLTVTSGYDIKKNEAAKIGTYTKEILEDLGLVELKFTMDDAKIKSFKILLEDGKALGGDEKVNIDKNFRYIELLNSSLEDLTVEFYDEGGGLLYKARFDTANGSMIKKDEE